ncbi:2-oxoglutarate dehydrogenase E1 component [Marivibrio halodurans]|uniref:2-oxoglutarate dehydrogenase E1 component n=1 Tax=Marivibrio halodurans TaxID=2039722 RepID=A0A8J7V476_9PROT|nr:2-oxoglutarate dehydrogenase E1 component [Marivibrio halodurans]MBP5858792.1 2-oxoglutarate dehydrogenase E1 component [Marivibrio halodurans]
MAYIGETTPLYGANEAYIAELFEKWQQDPEAVDPGWAAFFETLGDEDDILLGNHYGPSWAPRETKVLGGRNGGARGRDLTLSDALSEPVSGNTPFQQLLDYLRAGGAAPVDADQTRKATLDSIRALMMIRAYRMRGHMAANLDPLGLDGREATEELDPAEYGFTEDDWDHPIFINYYLGLESATLREIVKICRDTYCGSIGVEFLHIQDAEEKSWIQERVESSRNRKDFTNLGRRTILQRLTQADIFETYLDKKYRGTKRFGLDGGESLVPMVEQIFKRGAQLNLEEVVLGMAHRGRLNILANVMQKPYQQIFAEFEGLPASPDSVQGSGDVKYHLGTSADREFDDKTVHLSLTANPSHLECVNTVVLGKVRAKQRQRGDSEREKVMGLLLHGDAAFIGQGVVAETFLLSQLDGYRTGGTIHIVINNQIGFTTAPSKSRSSPYCSDMAKTIDAPVFHVNGDDPEACVHVAKLAIEYRQKFKKDVVIDMWCYRRHGHNEGDEPMFTQPLMYKRIKDHPRTRQIYAGRLEKDGLIEDGAGEKLVKEFEKKLDDEFEVSKSFKPNRADWLEGKWSGLSIAESGARRGDTAVDMDLLKEVGHAISQVPQNFHPNSKIQRQLDAKRKMIDTGEGIDWGTAEALAFGTLLCESTSIRLSGEDSERGTFSQRHSVLIDQENEQRFVPLNSIRMGQAPFEVIDSPLSEFGLLGFEYGYASAEPHALVLWEAQFGDFANGAQVIIDQFISSGEAKWLRMCGLVMLLPHGYEGQGPEHSSARLERYLQNSAEDNWQVCNITQPANYFHALRRQVRRNFRKPLILMTPKSLLRHKKCVSKLSEFGPGTTFHRVLWDNAQLEGGLAPDNRIKRVVLCSGKVYFDLEAERDRRGIEDIYILRLEQLYPFPFYALGQELSRFPNADIVWCQEEPENMGAWQFLDRRIERVLDEIGHKPCRRPNYIGRDAAASPATGIAKRHQQQQEHIVEQALSLKPMQVSVANVKVGGMPALLVDSELPPDDWGGGKAEKGAAVLKSAPATKNNSKQENVAKAGGKKGTAKKASAKKAAAGKTSTKKADGKKSTAKKAAAKTR